MCKDKTAGCDGNCGCKQTAVSPSVKVVQPCPDSIHMGEHACANKDQCWEPCGCLGKDADHVKAVLIP